MNKAYTQTPHVCNFWVATQTFPFGEDSESPSCTALLENAKSRTRFPGPRSARRCLARLAGSGQGGLGSSTRSGEACPLCTLLQYRHAKIGGSKKQWTCMSATHSWMPLQILAGPWLPQGPTTARKAGRFQSSRKLIRRIRPSTSENDILRIHNRCGYGEELEGLCGSMGI